MNVSRDQLSRLYTAFENKAQSPMHVNGPNETTILGTLFNGDEYALYVMVGDEARLLLLSPQYSTNRRTRRDELNSIQIRRFTVEPINVNGSPSAAQREITQLASTLSRQRGDAARRVSTREDFVRTCADFLQR